MKRAAILTRTDSINFGTILQNYALQKAVKDFGYEVKTIDDRQPRRLYSGKTEQKPAQDSLKERIYRWYDQRKEQRADKRNLAIHKKCESFKKRYIEYDMIESLDEINKAYDIVISGSDQIWAQDAEPRMYPFFMQDFVSNKLVKASYAVSVGSDYSSEKAADVRAYLDDFDFLSVRESSSAKLLSRYTDKKAEIVCDPVLLLPSSQWDILAGQRRHKNRYIFCYFLSNNPWYFQKVKELVRLYPDRQVLVFEKKPVPHPDCIMIEACSPRDFLNDIKYADYVLTDSYHVFLFSLIFRRRINVLERFTNIENNFQNERLLYLMDRLGVKNKYLDEHADLDDSLIDYEAVGRRLTEFTDDSISYLKEILNDRKD